MRHPSSTIIIIVYFIINSVIWIKALKYQPRPIVVDNRYAGRLPEFSQMEDLEYFYLKNSTPEISLKAKQMTSQAEDKADFVEPVGLYYQNDQLVDYEGETGHYEKSKDLLELKGKAKLETPEGKYEADYLQYFLLKNKIIGEGHLKVKYLDKKTGDNLDMVGQSMVAYPQKELSYFTKGVDGVIKRKRRYEGDVYFKSEELDWTGSQSMMDLRENVYLKRLEYEITGGKAKIYLENYHKKLKYFVFNDDVVVREKFKTKEGLVQRKAYSEKLEGFGAEALIVLTGAPRVEQGKDIVKGYRITMKHGSDVLEVDDALTDMEIKKKGN